MKLSTKGRYAVMAMVDLALHQDKETPIPLGFIAQRQSLPITYLEKLFSRLRRKNLVKSARGQGGGYTLARPPQNIPIADIVFAADEPVQMTRCNKNNDKGCQGRGRCATHDLWEGLHTHILDYLQNVSLKDVCEGQLRHAPTLHRESIRPEREVRA